MHLFIANGTHQVQDFHYRLPEQKQVRRQPIGVGQQIRISDDLRPVDIEAILKQYSVYGIIAADEITKGTSQAPFAYRVGSHIKSEEIEFLTQRNRGVLVSRGRESRDNAAIVMGNALGVSARDSGTGVEFEQAEIEVIEEQAKGASTGDPKIDETTVITRTDRPDARAPSGRRSRRR